MCKEKLPLVVDLDGTLINTDVVYETVAKFLRQYPWRFGSLFIWWLKGRAHLKKAIANYITIDPKSLPYNQALLEYLRHQHQQGRELILATGTDESFAHTIADHLGLFKKVFASDGIVNLTSQNKANKLVEYYGQSKFIYVGNSAADLAVWKVAAAAIAVNAPGSVVEQLRSLGVDFQIFK